MPFLSFDERLRMQIRRRDAAILRVTQETNAAGQAISNTISTKTSESVGRFAKEHKWLLVMGALAAGIVAIPIIRNLFTSTKKPEADSKRVVIEMEREKIEWNKIINLAVQLFVPGGTGMSAESKPTTPPVRVAHSSNGNGASAN